MDPMGHDFNYQITTKMVLRHNVKSGDGEPSGSPTVASNFPGLCWITRRHFHCFFFMMFDFCSLFWDPCSVTSF